MRCQVSKGQIEASGRDPCSVCRKGVRSIQSCAWSVTVGLKKCSGISGKLKNNIDFHCERCLKDSFVLSVLLREVEVEPNVKLECVSRFCCLGDTLGPGEGVEEAVRARVRCAWAKFWFKDKRTV